MESVGNQLEMYRFQVWEVEATTIGALTWGGSFSCLLRERHHWISQRYLGAVGAKRSDEVKRSQRFESCLSFQGKGPIVEGGILFEASIRDV